ncbi:MAG: reverse transcriptase domain-containing protein [Roseibacillus sp.]
MNHKTSRQQAAQNWNKLDWEELQQEAFTIQSAIYHATRNGENSHLTQRLQKRLTRSFSARALAVRKVCLQNNGRKTAGPDRLKNPNKETCYEMAIALSLKHQPSPPRYTEIAKAGTNEKRKLSIPNLIDRAHQELIRMALEPQSEARFPKRMFGFRKGRSQQDARRQIENMLRKRPSWVLDADISKFFDSIDRETLIAKIDSTRGIRKAVSRILVTLDGEQEDGIPQGGPLCPLLANIVMTGLPDFINEKLILPKGCPTPGLVIYADDLLVFHEDKDIVKDAQIALVEYLSKFSLSLNPSKTKIRHTLEKAEDGDRAGFTFLGFHFQHFSKPRYNDPAKQPGTPPYFIVTPSDKSVSRHLTEIRGYIKNTKILKKQRGAHRHQMSKGQDDKVSTLIRRTNAKQAGWANYFRHCNAKRTFSKVDHRIYVALSHWGSRSFKHKTAAWRRDNLFGGIERDKEGKPMKRRDGEDRERSWVFKSPYVSPAGEHVTLFKVADVSTAWSPPMVQISRSYFDGDWHYWGGRTSSYPNIPSGINRSSLKRQLGKCTHCKRRFLAGDGMQQVSTLRDGNSVPELVHVNCHP